MDLSRFNAISFDCYGTLIDWETGILNALRPILVHHGRPLPPAEILALYGQTEAAIESVGFRPYREVLEEVVREFGRRLQFEPSEEEVLSLPRSLADWEPFPDTVPALRELKQRFRLVVISNVDDDLFAHSARKLQVPFDAVVTAQQVGSYKPNPRNFQEAQLRAELQREKWLHVAESLFHDVAVCNKLGIASVWVNRRKGKGMAATPLVEAKPDLVVNDLAELAGMVDARYPAASV